MPGGADGQGQTEHEQHARDGASRRQLHDLQRHEPQRRGRGDEQHIAEQRPGEQVGSFAAVRGADIGQHARVDDDAVAEHVVLRHRGSEHDDEPDRLHPAAPGGERQQGRRQGREDDGDDENHQQAARAGIDARELAPERDVARHGQPDRQDGGDRHCRARLRPGRAGARSQGRRRASPGCREPERWVHQAHVAAAATRHFERWQQLAPAASRAGCGCVSTVIRTSPLTSLCSAAAAFEIEDMTTQAKQRV